MAYQALYRKWRPQTFAEVKGQDHIVTTIRNQVATGHVSHAYLFCGTRGTGKTTVAKILAKAVNCENPQGGEPCGCCRLCKSIGEGNSLNVFEIDAASNNGVDYIREIRDEVQYSPTEGKYKVYIIDEAHMLTANAFNAFLKTIEEPPEYVIFIFATTEANKILQTVESRCQRYDFHRIDVSVISERLREMCAEEGIEIEDSAIRFIALKGEGSMRDAITLLDKCSSSCTGRKITYDEVLSVLGASDTETCSEVYRALVLGDAGAAIKKARESFEKGIDAQIFVSELIRYLRALMLLSAAGDSEDILEMSRDGIKQVKEDSGLAELAVVLRYLRILSELLSQLRASAQRITSVEMALVRMAKPETEADVSALTQRIENLEKEIKRLKATEKPIETVLADETEEPQNDETSAKKPQYETDAIKFKDERTADGNPSDIMSHWAEIVESIGGGAFIYLKGASVEQTGSGEGIVYFPDKSSYEFGANHRNLDLIRAEIKRLTGEDLELTAAMRTNNDARADTILKSPKTTLTHEDIQKRFGMDVQAER